MSNKTDKDYLFFHNCNNFKKKYIVEIQLNLTIQKDLKIECL